MAILKREAANLYYEVTGAGAPVLLIQGVGVIGEAWRPQVQGLAGHVQTLHFDNRGIGRSAPCTGFISIEAMAEDARVLMDAVGWDSAHVVGHSMGGVIAQQLALDCPQRIRSLSLLCTFARGIEAARLTPWVMWMTLRTRVGSRRMRRQAFLEMLFPEDYLASRNLERLAAELAPLLGRDLADQPSILLKQVRALSRHNRRDQLAALAGIPTWVLSGEDDPIALPHYGRSLAQAIPGAKFEEWRAVSHGLTLQSPSEVNARLKRFLDESEAAWAKSSRQA